MVAQQVSHQRDVMSLKSQCFAVQPNSQQLMKDGDGETGNVHNLDIGSVAR
jgi:hypothetical protein